MPFLSSSFEIPSDAWRGNPKELDNLSSGIPPVHSRQNAFA
jgi:hypothetical protein